jgi:hypothetical protein
MRLRLMIGQASEGPRPFFKAEQLRALRLTGNVGQCFWMAIHCFPDDHVGVGFLIDGTACNIGKE